MAPKAPIIRKGRFDITSKPLGIPTNGRVSANEWYSIFCALGARLNIVPSEPKTRITNSTCRQVNLSAEYRGIEFDISVVYRHSTQTIEITSVPATLGFRGFPLDVQAAMLSYRSVS